MSRFSFYSIIVPSYNRHDEIVEMLESIRRLDFPTDRFEVVIADDGSTDATADWIRSQIETTDFDLRLLQQENKGPGAARNLGLAEARGDFFIFIDSDCTVTPNWLSAIDEGLTREEADAFGGPDSYREDFSSLLKAINYSMTSFLTTGGIRGSTKRIGKFYPRSFNMGLSRLVYNKIGGFGGLRHGQDIEFSHRIIKSGAVVRLFDDAIVYHKRRTSLRKFFRQVFNWGVARINLYKLDSGMLELVHALPAIATFGIVSLAIVSLFSQSIAAVFGWMVVVAIILVGASAIHSMIVYRDWRQLVWIPLVMPIQILGYGFGFGIAYVLRVVFDGAVFTGFTKKYYG